MNLNQYTIKAQEAVQAAQQLAYINQNANIETAHLLKAILGDKDSPTDFLLKKNNFIIQKTNINLNEFFEKSFKLNYNSLWICFEYKLAEFFL